MNPDRVPIDQEVHPGGAAPKALRILCGVLGIMVMVYFGGGLIVKSFGEGLVLTDTIYGVAVAVGACMVVFGVRGAHSSAMPVARGALVGSAIGAVLAVFPGTFLLAQFVGGVAPAFLVASIVLPLMLLLGGFLGARRSLRRLR
jgi:hypothetical protein